MYNDKKILAVIPARGGSKGLPDKNIKKLYNKPLIVWSIEQAKESKYIDRVIVSTDSNEIAKIAVDHGAEVPFIRPSELAKDNTPTIDVLVHLINHLENNGSKYDILLLLEPTSPLRKRGDIDNAMKAFIDNYKNADSVISLGEVHLENPHAIKTIEN
ncbi:MAG: acylneuraminate cytidylyltransferase family protein, partial [Proteobacteria bacterium]|nr:acylneuraminate cytidylyltransferase family protein [Pseudomonadota bacterium]